MQEGVYTHSIVAKDVASNKISIAKTLNIIVCRSINNFMMDNLTNHVSFVPFEGIDQIYLKDSNHPEVNVRAKTDDWQDID